MAPERDNRTSKLGLIVLLGAMTAFAPMSIDMYLPGVPAMVADLRGGPAMGHATMSVFLVGLAFGQLIHGPASDRWGRRPPVLVGAAVYVAASLLCAAATSTGMLLSGRFLQAVGGCAAIVVARAVVADRFDSRESARIFSSLILVLGAAPILAPLAGGAILGWIGWRGIFVFQAVFGLLVGLAALRYLAESRSEATRARAIGEHPARAYGSGWVSPVHAHSDGQDAQRPQQAR